MERGEGGDGNGREEGRKVGGTGKERKERERKAEKGTGTGWIGLGVIRPAPG